jgi:DNA-binding transcriptional MerR regulator
MVRTAEDRRDRRRPGDGLLAERVEQGRLTAPDGERSWEEVGYRGPQVCKIVGITYRQLDYWARTDLLRPSLADARGSGTQRRYSYRDLVALKVIKGLLDAGVSLQRARQAIAYLREHLGEDLATASLVVDENRSVLVRSGEEILDLVRQGQTVLNVVPLAGLVEQLEASISELAPPPAAGRPRMPVPAAEAAGDG